MTRPRITLKLATSIDGRIALSNGISQWITGSAARARVHAMRAAHDAVMVGRGTVLSDDPLLTARTLPLPQRQPKRIVADSNARTPVSGRLVQSVGLGEVIIAHTRNAPASHLTALEAAGASLWRADEPASNTAICLDYLMRRCIVEDIKSIFLEGGGTLAASFIKAGLVDQLEWFRAPLLIGADGRAALGGLGLSEIKAAPHWRMTATETIGEDILERYERRDA